MGIINITYNGRYQLHDTLGQGGMGIVYRATDRLSGDIVALKQIRLPSEPSTPSNPSHTQSDLHLALAHEFQLLATLRHPHIISVRDYGFYNETDESGDPIGQPQPFFTMSYLENAQTILEAGAGMSAEGRIHLLRQMLEALAYLHRRGILHRDLKPGNVLVTEQTTRLLDFGLSSVRGSENHSTGTWAYLAPELLENEPPTPAADLYAVGVIAYQLFAGRHPFDPTHHEFIDQLLDQPPELNHLQANDALKAVIGKLLAKKPNGRYADATATITALLETIGQSASIEKATIRESYLQAATFVGREAEMTQLTTVLEQAQAGNGSVLLIGGESGVGKSRLLDEFRIQAVVKGWQVVRGQAIFEGGAPYHLWRNIIRHLALSTNLTDLEAGTLKAIAPEIEHLLGRPIPAPPELAERAAQQRLMLTLVNVLQRQTQPTLLLLEDLHWALESLVPIQYLARLLTHEKLLVIGTYRDDESPNLPQQIPEATSLPLTRLDKSAVAKLSSAMLGKAVGQRTELIQLLHQETEGNTFFLVEVVQALAEAAGSMADIVTMSLPKQVLTGGIQQIVRRRLARVLPHHQPLLKLAAVAGRELDLDIFTHLQSHSDGCNGDDLDIWLLAGQEAGVLAVQENRWRFAHDKLRQAVLADLSEAERVAAHQAVAEAIEQTYGDAPVQASLLTRHWEAANHAEKAQRYAFVAGQYAVEQYANEEAVSFFGRALALTSEGDLKTQYDCLLAREKVFNLLGKRESQQQDVTQLAALADKMDEPGLQAAIALRQAAYFSVVGDLAEANVVAQRAVELAEAAGDHLQSAAGQLTLGSILRSLGEHAEARMYLKQCLATYRELDNRRGEGAALIALGHTLRELGEHDGSRTCLEQGLTIGQQLGNRRLETRALNNLGILLESEGMSLQAQSFFTQCLTITRETGDRVGEGAMLQNLGLTASALAEFDRARTYFEQSSLICYEVEDRYGEGLTNGNFGELAFSLGQYDRANEYFTKALAIFQEIKSSYDGSWMLACLGENAHLQGNYEQAQIYFEQAIAMAKGNPSEQSWIYGIWGWLAYAQGLYEQARSYFKEAGAVVKMIDYQVGLIQVMLTQGEDYGSYLEDVLAYLKEDIYAYKMERPLRAYLVCYHALRALEDERAEGIVRSAYALIQERAAKIQDAELRRSFLENVPENKEIVSLATQQGLLG